MIDHAPSPRPDGRALAPDLARGIMLLFIALANVPWFLYGSPTWGVSAHHADGTGLDAVWQTVAIIAIDARSYPLFAFLFGYGIWQLHTRQRAIGLDERSVRRLLLLRHLWMIVFGAVHAALLWFGDVLGAYGLVGLLVVLLFLRRGNRTLLVWAAALFGLLGVLAVALLVAGAVLSPGADAAFEGPVSQIAAITPYTASILPRLGMWAVVTVGQGVLGLVVPVAVLVAIVCARHRVLESPESYRPLLARTAVLGIALGWAGALPSVLVRHGVWDVPEWTPLLLHGLTGLFGALGYVALIALVVASLPTGRPAGTLVRTLTAVGKRSLSCYLLQSVVFAPLLCAWGLGLGGVLTQWQAALVAVATWLLSAVLAAALEHAGVRGPAERLLRVLAYRDRDPSATPTAP
ncbi:DUF418 domain-containing protein [Nocardiopsis sp. N85]|uniref:DUF418 domain-containing protein n=1 Tax=Nocardiopsis sp. N85 TaxID=3029400 RepID=UPI00237F75A1|nr:DUF418 domain-containing protein [Nocardiopsis sp. N85]MDE3725043.1 DUF418 domain-containing protein [Nocardiopsis sp. N85]